MAYSTPTQVVEEFKDLQVALASSVITTAKLTRFIEEADAEIDSILSTKYAVPIVGASALIQVRTISIWLVADRVKEILKVKNAATEVSQDVRGSLREQALKRLQDIVKGVLPLLDQDLASTSDGISSFNVSSGQEHQFRKGENQW